MVVSYLLAISGAWLLEKTTARIGVRVKSGNDYLSIAFAPRVRRRKNLVASSVRPSVYR